MLVECGGSVQIEVDAGTAAFRRLVEALRDTSRYSHPCGRVELLETHISCILLCGEYAYKLKKPVNLGFVDFSTLEARRHCCNEEVRLNRRTAPWLYLDVIAITGSVEDPRLGGQSAPIEYAVRMRRFPQDDLLDRVAARGGLAAGLIDGLADGLASFHAQAGRVASGRTFATAQLVLEQALQNFEQMDTIACFDDERVALQALRDWTLREHADVAAAFDARRRDGFVRECHGDLHLGNIVLHDGVPAAFDCIEFNENFRWIDVMSDIAFPVMDLVDHGLAEMSWRLLDGYLERSGDFAGLALFRFYLVYRALVRAKVAGIRAAQPDSVEAGRSALASASRHLALAQRFAAGRRGGLLIMHGVSGSGKSTVSQALLESLGAVRLRSDVERKRMHGLASSARSGSRLDSGMYSSANSALTYARLAQFSRGLLASGYLVVVDAAFLDYGQRRAFGELAREAGVPFCIISCSASAQELRRRVALRSAMPREASEAGSAVLERQFAALHALHTDEAVRSIVIDTERGAALPAEISGELERRLQGAARGGLAQL